MRTHGTKSAGQDDWSGGSAVALFVAACVVIAALLLAPETGDHIIRYVPSTAVMYLHGRGNAYTKMTDDPSSLHPDEFALVRLPMNGHDVSATVLSWRPYLLGPSRTERAELDRLNAVSLGRDTFAFGDTAAIMALKDGSNGKLDADHGLVRALNTDRSAFAVQAMISGKLIPSSSILRPQLPDDDRIIVGLNLRTKGFFGAIGSTSRFDDFGALGYASPTGSDEPMSRAAANEIETVTAGPNDLNLLAVAFEPIKNAGLAAGAPDPGTVDDTAGRLRAALADATIHVLRGPKGPVVALTLPDTGYDGLVSALTDYLNAAFPTKRPLIFPDGTIGNELIVGSGQVFTKAGNDTIRLSAKLRQNYGVDLFVRKEHGTVTIAPDTGTLAELTNAPLPSSEPCPGLMGGPSSVVLHDAADLTSFSLPIEALLERTSTSHVAFKKREGNLISICGY